jgi:hypothetical protein
MIAVSEHEAVFRDEILNLASQFHLEALNEVEVAKALSQANITNSFTSMIDEAIANPLSTSYKGLLFFEESIRLQLSETVVAFLKKHQRVIKKIFQTNPNFLNYYIILKKDTINNRGKLFAFLAEYQQTAISHKFPILFQFVPEELESDFNNYQEISLN